MFGTRCDSERGASGVQGCAGAPVQRDLASIADLSCQQMPSCGIVEEGRLFRSRPSELALQEIPCLWHLPTCLAARMAVSSAPVSLIISGPPSRRHEGFDFACLLRRIQAKLPIATFRCKYVRHWCARTQLRGLAASMYAIGASVRNWCACGRTASVRGVKFLTDRHTRACTHSTHTRPESRPFVS